MNWLYAATSKAYILQKPCGYFVLNVGRWLMYSVRCWGLQIPQQMAFGLQIRKSGLFYFQYGDLSTAITNRFAYVGRKFYF